MLPRISVDEAKCTNPLGCRKCLLICPTQVLNARPKSPPQKYREIDSGDFRIMPVHLLNCSVCMDCVNICPEKAIQVHAGRG